MRMYRIRIKAPVIIVSFLVVLFISSVKLTVIASVMVIAGMVGIMAFRGAIKKITRDNYDMIGDQHKLFNELLNGFRVFSIYGARSFMADKLTACLPRWPI
jgi:ABC-type bacteriocin/lantibiotic exporter with double-glycine peptidase domain